jgi:triphosphoribosyl-dephospho-CoA synthetase
MTSLSLAAPIEVDELKAAVELIAEFRKEGSLTVILDAVENAGRLAAEHKAFRPQELYSPFLDACAGLRRLRDSDSDSWREELLEQSHRGAKATALRAQAWAARARIAASAVRVIQRCLEDSTKEVQARFKLEVGLTPEQANSNLAETVRQIDHQLARLEK